jgi:hypothetical protein
LTRLPEGVTQGILLIGFSAALLDAAAPGMIPPGRFQKKWGASWKHPIMID